MKKRINNGLLAMLVICSSGSVPAFAQSEDIGLRSQAFIDCLEPGMLGYGTYEICVEARYQDLLQQALFSNSDGGGGGGSGGGVNFDQTCNSAASRIPCRQ